MSFNSDLSSPFAAMMEKKRLICIVRGIRPEQAGETAEALCRGGIRLAEITFDSTGKTPDAVTARMIADAAKRMEGKMFIGAGTVLTKEQVLLTKNAGGSFIISPNMDPEIIRFTKENGLISIPAAMTVSEIVTADRSGADYVKIFPTSCLGGPAFFKAMKGPLPGLRLLAVYGISVQEIPDYLSAGAFGFGIGGAIVNRKLCDEGNYAQIEENARFFTRLCEKSEP